MAVLVLGTGAVLNFDFSPHFFGGGRIFAQEIDTGEDGTEIDTGNGDGEDGDRTPPGDSQIIALPNPLGTNSDIESILKSIIDWLIIIGAPIATGMIIFGAYQMLFAAGDPAKFKTGQKTILYTVIGYGIILIGWGITSIIEEILNSAKSP